LNVRISLTERLRVEANGVSVDEPRFPGRQGRIVFAYLAAQHGCPVSRDELAELLWSDALPATWEKALRVLMTKLRAVLEECGIDGSTALTSAFGCYKLSLPGGSWIDVHAAVEALERAEVELAAGDAAQAKAQAATAAALARKVFLPGEEGPWVEEKRRDLHEVLVRAVECVRDASFGAGDFAEAVRHGEELIRLEPFRESGYRRLMEAHAAAGNPAEALRAYERCRRFLADELGAYPSAESEGVYLDVLRSSSGASAEVERVADSGLETPPSQLAKPPRGRRRRTALLAVVVLVAAGATAAGLALASGDRPALEIVPNSLVRLDPDTLEPKQVVPVGPRADLVVVAGGYVWITHGLLRHTAGGLRDYGDRTVTRVDPSTGETTPVGGLAPCGMTADPSGDVWVANCYASGSHADVVRVDAKTLRFEEHLSVPAGDGYYRGMTYGGGSLWVADLSGDASESRRLTQRTRNGTTHSIRLDRHANALAWAEGYGDLWMTNFNAGSVARMHGETEEVKTLESVAGNPGAVVVDGDAVWVGDWDKPRVVRLSAVGSKPPHRISLPVVRQPAGVTSVAADSRGIWATVPEDRSLVRIDPRSNLPTRIPMPYAPWGVAVDHDGIWVAFRGRAYS
jgi:DNA-binding SARP family transcriptional activator/streptogramin lyase